MENATTISLMEQVRIAYEQKSDLPSPVHVTANDGRFLYANAEARAIFGLGEDPTQHNIANLYEDEKERKFVLRELKKVTPGQWRKNFKALLVIQGSRLKVRFVSKPFFDEKGEIIAMLNLTEGMSRVEWYADLEDELEVGLFVIDRQLKVADCNHFLAKMLGFESTDDIKGKPVTQFMWEPESASTLLRTLLETPTLRKEPMKLKRLDGAMVLIEMSCEASSLEAGEISRIRGVVKDITFKVFYDDLPVGLFLINNSPSGEDIISQVNLTFAKMHGFETVASVLGKPSDIFQGNPLAYAAYKEELNRASKENRPLLDYYMEISDKNGKKRNVVVNVRFLSDQKGQIRVGAVYDLTDHVAKNTRTLASRFSSLLHTYIATINGLRDTLNMLINAHGKDVKKDALHIDREKAMSEMMGHKKRMETLLDDLKETIQARGIDTTQFNKLKKHWDNIFSGKILNERESVTDMEREEEKPRDVEREKKNASWSRRNFIEIKGCITAYKNAGLPRELLKNLRGETDEMLRLTSMISISLSVDEINERIQDFYFLRDYLLQGTSEQKEFKSQNLTDILYEGIQQLDEFASTQKVAMLLHFNQRERINVTCHKTALLRALHSLLNNAVKYSWSKGRDRGQAWIDVHLSKSSDEVEIIIENWGVPIRKEELENNLILQFGKRGRESEDRGRAGTGIGLYDASEIIKRHQGSLRLTSEPTFGNAPNNYTKPFITRAYITLPIVKEL